MASIVAPVALRLRPRTFVVFVRVRFMRGRR
jgi:hypothetical protein